MNDKEFLTAMLGKVAEVLLGKILEESFVKNNNKSQNINKLIISHLRKRMKTLMIMNTIVLGNKGVFLDDIYVPLTIYLDENNYSSQESYLIDCYPQQLYNKYSTVLITDTAGMGKSTIMKKLFFSSIYEDRAIPFLIELRRIKQDEDIMEYILRELKIKSDSPNHLALKYLFETGGFVFFLDGYDEINEKNKTHVSESISSFVQDFFDLNRFFITSRPESGVTEFGHFKEFKIEGLTQEESFELIRKYDESKSISELLIGKLSLPEYASLAEFLRNPLLTSLLYRAFEYKNKIPLRKSQFYRQVYDANFESHDLTKGGAYYREKISGLDIDDFHRILRYIGFKCLKLQTVEFDNKDNLLSIISEAYKFFNIRQFKASDFLNDLLNSVPLFTKEGNYYRWCHRSIQEYFAAQFIFMDTKDDQSKILLNIYNHNSLRYFINTLELYADIDPISFTNCIELNYLEEYIEHIDKYLNSGFVDISEADLLERANLTYHRRIAIYQNSSEFLKSIPKEVYGDDNEKEDEILEPNLTELFTYYDNLDSDSDVNIWEDNGIVYRPRYGLNTFLIISYHAKVLIGSLLYKLGRSYIDFESDHEITYINIPIPAENQDKVYHLDNSKELCFNSKYAFNNVNRLLKKGHGYYKIDLKNTKKELDAIKKRTNAPKDLFNF